MAIGTVLLFCEVLILVLVELSQIVWSGCFFREASRKFLHVYGLARLHPSCQAATAGEGWHWECNAQAFLMFSFPTGRHSLMVYNCRGSRNDGDLQLASPAAELLLIFEAARTARTGHLYLSALASPVSPALRPSKLGPAEPAHPAGPAQALPTVDHQPLSVACQGSSF